jgi:hypothetical protein
MGQLDKNASKKKDLPQTAEERIKETYGTGADG